MTRKPNLLCILLCSILALTYISAGLVGNIPEAAAETYKKPVKKKVITAKPAKPAPAKKQTTRVPARKPVGGKKVTSAKKQGVSNLSKDNAASKDKSARNSNPIPPSKYTKSNQANQSPKRQGVSSLTSQQAYFENSKSFIKKNKHGWKPALLPKRLGYSGPRKRETLNTGTLIDRYGSEYGHFSSPKGTPFEARSLYKGAQYRDLTVYRVVKPLETTSGTVAPFYGQKGGGTQYMFSKSIKQLVKEGYLEKVK